jgi:hypothetical protein
MDHISPFTAFRLFRTAWKCIAFAIKKPHSALRHIQKFKCWGLSWDFCGFLGMYADGSGPVYISCLQAFAVNKSQKDIRSISGYVQSNVTGQRLPLIMEGMTPEETNGVPAQCRFFIQALFRDATSTQEGIVEEKFLQIWSDFTFVFTADGRQYEYRFSPREVNAHIAEFSLPLRKPPAPEITRKPAQ